MDKLQKQKTKASVQHKTQTVNVYWIRHSIFIFSVCRVVTITDSSSSSRAADLLVSCVLSKTRATAFTAYRLYRPTSDIQLRLNSNHILLIFTF